MFIHLLTTQEELSQYDAWVKSHSQGSLWQSLEWKKYQESLGRTTSVYTVIRDPLSVTDNGKLKTENFLATALVVIDRTTGGLSTWDCPRGPLSGSTELIERIISDAKKEGCMSLYVSPSVPLSTLNSQLSISSRHQQPEATRILDLTLTDEQLLAQMHQKGRYNINVAKKNNVRIERSNDIDAYYTLAQKTGKRDAFGIPSKKQLRAFLEHLPDSFLLLAYTSSESSGSSDSSPISGLIGVYWNGTGIYYYGASDYEHRALMAPYLLQWEAIQLCKKAGCRTYDLLGVAPADAQADHPWNGISDFKSKFGGTVISYPPEQEITLKPLVKQLLEVKRKVFG